MWHSILVWSKKIDWFLFLNIALLSLFSLTALYSLNIGQSFNLNNLFVRQLIFVIVGFILAILLSFIDYRWLKNYYKVWLGIVLFLLLLVLFFAEPIRGMTGWLEIGGQTFQPSELAKLAVIIFLAHYFTERDTVLSQWQQIVVSGGVVFLFAVLVAMQPDFGSAAVIFGTWLVLLFFTKLPRRYFAYLLALLVAGAAILWFFVLLPYQQARLVSFLQPEQDALGSGYNVQQSMIAIGSGQVLGRGLGLGPQSQLNFLPEQYSDFIFAVIAESLGLWGTWLLLGLFLILFIRLTLLVRDSGSTFAAWLVLGFVIYLCLQVIINIAMNIGWAPVTGITLPFVSYGGSSMLTSFITLGIIQSIIIKRREKLFTPAA
ncbi:MAG: rod shape-determining protein RodA [Candidatus Komeilibacteria bacterium]